MDNVWIDAIKYKADHAVVERIWKISDEREAWKAECLELRAANATLEQRVRKLTAELQQALFDLKEAQINIKGMADHNAKQRYQLQDEITRRESAERGLAEMIKAHTDAMTRLSKYEKLTA